MDRTSSDHGTSMFAADQNPTNMALSESIRRRVGDKGTDILFEKSDPALEVIERQ